MSLESMLTNAIASATNAGYKIGAVEINQKPIPGRKVGYSYGARKGTLVSGKITLDSRFVEWCEAEELRSFELLDTVQHELAHLIAETLNTKKKHVWHGDAWKDIHVQLGGNGSRYYVGKFVKPENKDRVFRSMDELRKVKATQPASTWEEGTFYQWLERGYHVIRGQHGTPRTWAFNANEYEPEMSDGKTSTWGRATAVYFRNDQVEPN